jgi:hypothetical protein
VSGLKSGTYGFRLSATDDKGAEGHDDVQIFVKEPAQPVADAGDDMTVHLPAGSVTIAGTATGGGAGLSSVSWAKRSGPRCTLKGANTSTLTVSDLVPGRYVLRLTVRNEEGGEAFDDVSVDVTYPARADVKSGQVAGRPPAAVITEILSHGDSNYHDGKPILDNLTSSDLEDCRVRIFDASGKCLYSGAWTAEKYGEVFSNGGLYIYNVLKDGRRVDAGKIWVRP